MCKKFNSKKDEYIAILLDGTYSSSDLPFLNSLTVDQLKGLITREDDELVEDPETQFYND